MLAGPFDRPVQVRTPLNPEGWFGLAVTALVAIGSVDRGSPRRQPSGRSDAVAVAVLCTVGLAAFWRVFHFYFLSDDFIVVQFARGLDVRTMGRLLVTPGGDGFFRPLAYLSWGVNAWLAGIDPRWWHAASLALHLVNALLVYALASQWDLSRPAACFAALLFTIHGTRPEAVAWIAGRPELLASFFVLVGLLLFLRAHRAAALVCMALAILSKETAYVFPLLLAWYLLSRREWPGRPMRILLPFGLTAAALFAYRWWLFGGIGGYRDPHTQRAAALTFGLASAKALALRMWAALYFPINWSVEPERWLAVLTITGLAALMVLAGGRANRALTGFAIGFTIVCALPPLHLLSISGDLGNSRLLYLPSVGFCLLLAAAADGLDGRARWIVPSVLVAFHLAALEDNLNSWEYASRTARATAIAAGQCGSHASGVPGTLRGVPFFANGFAEAAAMQGTGAAEAPKSWAVWNRETESLECVSSPPASQPSR